MKMKLMVKSNMKTIIKSTPVNMYHQGRRTPGARFYLTCHFQLRYRPTLRMNHQVRRSIGLCCNLLKMIQATIDHSSSWCLMIAFYPNLILTFFLGHMLRIRVRFLYLLSQIDSFSKFKFSLFV